MGRTANVPPELRELYDEVEAAVAAFFGAQRWDPETAQLRFSGERYVLVRASSMSVQFVDRVQELCRREGRPEGFEVARSLLYNLGHAMGHADSKVAGARLDLVDPPAQLVAGPAHFAFAGWANVDMLSEGHPGIDPDTYLLYDHPNSFEADAWLEAGRRAQRPICVMNAGYASGWTEGVFDTPMLATEVTCRAMGHEHCRFVMARPHRMTLSLEEYFAENPDAVLQRVAVPGISGIEEHFGGAAFRDREVEYQAVFDGVTDGLAVVDEDGLIVHANAAFAHLVGRGAAACEGAAVDALVPLDPPFLHVRRRLAAGASFQSRTELGAGETDRVVEVKASPIFHRGRERTLVGLRDITEAEQARRELERVNAVLQEVNGDLCRVRDQAVAANRAKSEFIARMSHEFRTPLNAVIGYTELMLEDVQADGGANEQLEGDLTKVRGAATHLLELINEVLDMAKIEAGEARVSVEFFSLRELLEGVIDVARPAALDAGNRLSASMDGLPGSVCADRLKIRQIVLNLLSNAVKFTANGDVSLSAHVAQRTGDFWLEVAVSDTGIGISEKGRRDLFSPFHQADESTSRRYGGTGLGLAISQGFARLMGGDIRVESVLGEGSTFFFEMPILVAPERSAIG